MADENRYGLVEVRTQITANLQPREKKRNFKRISYSKVNSECFENVPELQRDRSGRP